MSLLLDALRKGRSRGHGRPSAAGSTRADAVLQTLGYGPPPRNTGRVRRTLAWSAAAVVLIALGAWLWPKRFPSIPAAATAQSTRLSHPAGPAPREPARDSLGEPSREPSRQPPRELPREASREPSSDLRLALYYHRSGDFENALATYRAVLARNELNAVAHNNLGLLYQQKGLLEESAREFARATFINRRYARAHSNLGVTLMRQGKLDPAIAEFELASSLDRRDAGPLVNLALAQKSARQPDVARATLLRALALDPSSAAAHYNLALLYEESGEISRAVEHYREFLRQAGVDHVSLVPDVRARIDVLTASPQ